MGTTKTKKTTKTTKKRAACLFKGDGCFGEVEPHTIGSASIAICGAHYRREAFVLGRIVELVDRLPGRASPLRTVERLLVANAIALEGGNVSRAAARLRVDRKALERRARRYGIDAARYRPARSAA